MEEKQKRIDECNIYYIYNIYNMSTTVINKIKNSRAAKTTFGKSIYSNMWYVDTKNKICITFSPRGGCSIAFQQYLDLIGLLDFAFKYSSFIHHFRTRRLISKDRSFLVTPYFNLSLCITCINK